MDSSEHARFAPLYERMLQELEGQGKHPKTIQAYSRAVYRAADFFRQMP